MSRQHRPPLVAAAVIVHQRRLLLVRRTRAEPRLVWGLPAGKPENSEHLEETAVRETWEETGLRVHAAANLGNRIHPGTGWNIHYIACTLKPGTGPAKPHITEIEEIAWASHTELSHYVPDGFDPRVQTYLDSGLTHPGPVHPYPSQGTS